MKELRLIDNPLEKILKGILSLLMLQEKKCFNKRTLYMVRMSSVCRKVSTYAKYAKCTSAQKGERLKFHVNHQVIHGFVSPDSRVNYIIAPEPYPAFPQRR